MNDIELVQKIGNEICDGCGPDRDCGVELKECDRILTALDFVYEFFAGEYEEY